MKKIIIGMPHVPHIEDYSQPAKWYLEKRPVEDYNPDCSGDDAEIAFNPAPYLLVLECEGRRWDAFVHHLDDMAIMYEAEGIVAKRDSDLRAELLEGGRQEINGYGF